ncbi:hypothetical protein DICPUDRAFT_59401 [Dictyostelium purpureum]|uniref:Molybdenum cofactor sulfurase n=1 Tax=Dictyostelium purpureum TaxID=5786 RepID=F1A5V2_DICPU|nr:uncharacterized protein DICPUDRAFT_59401 [Dictyostelium purpureum]EGC28429.1 hypothetical protein DICPUDRAFT_59401 [Dictyostelium purpureum]|eukprot:XP_003295046.1 hypothetical protein DICPUDRAFT_59401 [Dictyostelium purpureum]
MLIFIVSIIITFLTVFVFKKFLNNNNSNNQQDNDNSVNNKLKKEIINTNKSIDNSNNNNNNNNNNVVDSSNSVDNKNNEKINNPLENDNKYKEEFLKFKNRFSKNNEYGYNGAIDLELRNHYSGNDDDDQFPKLKDIIYFDHTASTLPSKNQIKNISSNFLNNIYCNPHSINPIGLKTKESVDSIRELILNHFNAPYKQYSVIFTSGCTDSLKKVGEYFPWSENSKFYYSLEAHNSLLGIREYACEKGASFQSISSLYFKNNSFSDIMEIIEGDQLSASKKSDDSQVSYSLFGFPGQCNYSGSKYPLSIINQIQKKFKNVKVLLDAASLVGTSPLDLSKYPADFITISFYKMFGFPTGLGALIVKNDSSSILNKVYFSGGTVNASMAQERFHVHRDNIAAKFEDGTIDYMNIISLKEGFDQLERLGMENIQSHTFSMVQWLKEEISKLTHSNQMPLCLLYTDNHYKDPNKQGAIINFNLLRSTGEMVGYNEVEKLASLSNIFIRSGCFCNPGACHGYLNLTKSDIEEHLKEGHICWDDKDILNGKPTGSLRLSLGYMNNFEDLYKFVEFLKTNFINDHEKSRVYGVSTCGNRDKNKNKMNYLLNNQKLNSSGINGGIGIDIPQNESDNESESENEFGGGGACDDESGLQSDSQSDSSVELSEIYVYPVKSCSGYRVTNGKWELVASGLKYDREWTIIDQSGNYLNQKKLPILALIQTDIDLISDKLVLTAPEMKPISISLSYYPVSAFDQIQVCGDKVDGLLYGDKDFNSATQIDNVTNWLYQFTGKKCYLVRKAPESFRKSKVDDSNKISFANESPYLLINEESVKDLKERIYSDNPNSDKSEWNWISKHSFRANLIIKGGKPYQEDLWSQFQLISDNEENNQGNGGGSPSITATKHPLLFNLVGDCNRCKMVCINQKMGIEEREPLTTLSKYRRSNGKIIFGQHLNLSDSILNIINSNNSIGNGGSSESSTSLPTPVFINVPSKIKVISERY